MPTPVSGFSNLVTASGDWTAAINAAQAVENDAFLDPKPGQPYRVEGKLSFMRGRFAGTSDSVIEHYPPDDNTSCIVVTGDNYGRMLLEGFTIKGQQQNHPYGQDLIRIVKGDYNTVRDVTVDSAVRDGVNFETVASNYWIENTRLENVKVIGTYGAANKRGRDGFHFEVQNKDNVFINNTTMSNCETRSIIGIPVYAETKGTVQNQKIGEFNITDGSELAGSGPSNLPLVHFVANAGAPIENINILNTTIEDTGSLRTGPAIKVEGAMAGVFNFLGGTYHGTAAGVDGVDKLFKHFDINYIQNGSQIYRQTSQLGIKYKYRTLNLAPNQYEDAGYILNPEEILEGYIKGQYNGIQWFAKFTVWGTDPSCIYTSFAQNVSVSIVAGKLRITNLFGTAPLEMWLQCPVRDNSF